MGSLRVGREATIIARANSDAELEVYAGNRRFTIKLVNGEVFRFSGYMDRVVWDGNVTIAIFDRDVDVNVQVSSSGIITELQKVAKETTLQSIDSKIDVNLSTRASEATLQNILNQLDVALSTRASESTLQSIDSKLAQPTSIKSAQVIIDNSAGTTDLVQSLFATATPSKNATLKVVSISNANTIWIGDANTQAFALSAGDWLSDIKVSDLSSIYVKVPAGASATLEVLWEA